ncbi:hypothetical protein PLCT1_01836 [Planctomycetaceae bacterium]|nr:hypothetical protein PLCT1_01836 [Planctomycetaceae bacterium]
MTRFRAEGVRTRSGVARTAITLLLSVAGVAGNTASAAGQVVPRTVMRPETVLAFGFTRVGAVHELSDGRALVLDIADGLLYIIDAQWKGASIVGRKGSGPGEYALPWRLLALGGDSSALVDRGNERLLFIGADARPRGVMTAIAGQCQGSRSARTQQFRAADRMGRYYSEATPVAVSEGGALRITDSAAIERWTSRCQSDTVGFVPRPIGPGARLVAGFVVGSPGESERPFPAVTQWAVGLDGTVAIVYPDPYRVAFIRADGTRHATREIPYTKIRVDDAIKREWRIERQQAQLTTTLARDGSSMTAMERRPIQEPDSWPPFLPPFLADAVTFHHNGSVWVRRSTEAGAHPLYDEISNKGLVRQLVFPLRTVVKGFGRTHVLAVQRDEDDVERLVRFRFNQ